jgi:hypothetical protein
VASAKYIRAHNDRYGSPKPPRFDHDGINDIFIGKGLLVWYFDGGRWIRLRVPDFDGRMPPPSLPTHSPHAFDHGLVDEGIVQVVFGLVDQKRAGALQ